MRRAIMNLYFSWKKQTGLTQNVHSYLLKYVHSYLLKNVHSYLRNNVHCYLPITLTSQNELIQLQNKYLYIIYWGDFDKIAKDYHSLSTKPIITEEQRKYIVQANAMNDKKDYPNARQLFNKVIGINPTAYPAAYFNLALISAQEGLYLYAIVNMRKYLLLVPDAEDARAAQDKIYEWEFMMNQ